ncbi:MAG TPA: DNA polymerase [Chryseosolibacter sp.]|nr:DNA polymerase [Chryseosolibacter sp.]
MNAVVVDIEANDLYPFQTDIWTVVLKRIGGEFLTLNPFRSTPQQVRDAFLDFIGDNPTIIGHNFLGYDGWVLWKDLGLEMHVGRDTICGRPVTFFDTLFASQFLYPDRDGHSLKAWGERLGDHKIPYREVALDRGIIQPHENEFCRWSDEMDEYCQQDCKVTEQVYLQLQPQIESINAFRLGQKNFFLMNAQTFTGFKFDISKAITLTPRIEKLIADLKEEVEPDLPRRKLKKAEESFYTIPAKPYTKDGKFSATMNNFIVRHNAKVHYESIEVNGKNIRIIPGAKIINSLPMSLSDQIELKEYFLSIGWKPTLWNHKKDAKGKPVRDDRGKLITTSPKIQESGKICPNLLELDGDLPKKIVKFLSLRNRLSVLTGWQEHPRLAWDGRLPAGASGIASTHRQKHTVVVNVPKAEEGVLLGKEFRELFTVEDGFTLIGVDQAALEARCEAHWTFPFDNGERAKVLLEGDVHAINTKIFFAEETKDFDIDSPDFDKGHPGFKPYRSLSKNGHYCLSYGGQPKKLAQTLRKPEKEAQKLFDSYWAANPALKQLKDKIEYEWEAIGQKKWITGIDGRKLYSRSKHSLVNLLFQSTGAIIVDYALCLFDKQMGNLLLDSLGRPYYKYRGKILKRVGYFHDEAEIEAEDSVAPEIARIMEWCMQEAGKKLQLNIPLIGEAKLGKNWANVH